MDFGDILDEWERQTAKPLGKKGKKGKKEQKPETDDEKHQEKSKPASPPPPQQVHPLTAWLRLNDVPDKDADADADRLRPGELRRRLLHKRPDATIDLHGLTQQEAWTALEAFFQDARRRGFEKLTIIHGKGNHSAGEGVLKHVVKQYLERSPFAGERGHGNAADGGVGATWVLLKTPRPH